MAKVAETLHSLGDHLQVGASVRNVYGDPVDVGGRTVIPIARVSYGFGAGGGARGNEEAESERDGSGGGAGMSARPGRSRSPRLERASFHSSTRRVSVLRSLSDS